ncbi:GMC family oxidoreductase [Cohnella sp. JJ-181]|uniref:GMC family oxidoreductase n=1 Tax=Cohnella rhizoplanae TaxID=2974897 RepID=UPI0022FF9070|nr:GMC family oxidoreductase [Cohnella sp. JJ-181]CAI6075911.1 Gluconate 2-dehydrogenase flavoprotein [Cohnella sp. JJ-181]
MAKTLPKTDVVVVGVGWAGGIIAAELTKSGLNVVGLERGKERKTEDYFMVHDELRYALRYELMQDLSKDTVTFRSQEKVRALPMRQYGSFLLGEGLGGAGVHWNGQTYRFLPYDFQIRTKTIERYGKGKIPEGMTIQDWGITYEELEPYYDKFEKLTGISGEPNPLGGQRSADYPTPPMKKSPALSLFNEAASKLKLHPYMMPSANLSQNYTNPDGISRGACQYCAYCERFGCEYGAKADPVVTVLPVALKTGKFEIRTHSNVRRILHKGGKATGVMYTDSTTGEELIQPADIVVVTSYVFNNVKLLLMSGLGKPYDPASGTGVIGRNYAYQVTKGNAAGFFEDKEFNMFAGAGALGVTLDDYNGDNFDHSDLKFIHGAAISLSQTGMRPIANNPVPGGTASWGAEFKANSVKYANRFLSVGGQGSSMPFQHHFLDLDPTYKDAYGDPLVRLTFDFEEQDRQLAMYVSNRCADIMKEMGANHIDQLKSLGPYEITMYQSTHNTGGVVMGASPDTSAVNTYAQMWDAENVFVVGASAFPHNSGYNPTGTVGALAYRTAEGIIKYRQKGGMLV